MQGSLKLIWVDTGNKTRLRLALNKSRNFILLQTSYSSFGRESIPHYHRLVHVFASDYPNWLIKIVTKFRQTSIQCTSRFLAVRTSLSVDRYQYRHDYSLLTVESI